MSGKFNIQNNHGLASDFLTDSQIEEFAGRFKSYDPIAITEGQCYGTDINHPDFEWFDREFFPLIKKFTGNDRVHPIFAMYADFDASFKIHQDIKDIPDTDPNAIQFASFMIPISVDYDPKLCNKNSTLFFGRSQQSEPDPTEKPWHKLVPEAKRHLAKSHICTANYYWSRGSIIWWNSLMYHCGADMEAIGITSKQMFVIHTYVK